MNILYSRTFDRDGVGVYRLRQYIIGEFLFTYFASLAYVPQFPTEKFNDQL